MSSFMLKSILSIIILIPAGIAIFTMFEIFGREEKRYDVEKLKKIHKINGIFYFAIYLFISYLCLIYTFQMKPELSPRVTLHYLFAIAIILLLSLKMLVIKTYRNFYNWAKIIGILIVLLTFGMTGLSGGYYLLITKFGTEPFYSKGPKYKNPTVAKTIIREDK